MKKYILIAGVNGAGKSTLYHTIDSIQGIPRINTDEIVKEFGRWDNEQDIFNLHKIIYTLAKRNILTYKFEEDILFITGTVLKKYLPLDHFDIAVMLISGIQKIYGLKYAKTRLLTQ